MFSFQEIKASKLLPSLCLEQVIFFQLVIGSATEETVMAQREEHDLSKHRQ